MAETASIFTRIIRGEIPSQRVFENEHVLAFLDLAPLADGHTLVVPKRQVEQLHELPADEAAEIGRVLGLLGERIRRATGAEGYNVLQNNGSAAGQVVMHVHFHLIPRRAGDGLGYRWNAQKRTPEQLAEMAEKIRSA